MPCSMYTVSCSSPNEHIPYVLLYVHYALLHIHSVLLRIHCVLLIAQRINTLCFATGTLCLVAYTLRLAAYTLCLATCTLCRAHRRTNIYTMFGYTYTMFCCIYTIFCHTHTMSCSLPIQIHCILLELNTLCLAHRRTNPLLSYMTCVFYDNTYQQFICTTSYVIDYTVCTGIVNVYSIHIVNLYSIPINVYSIHIALHHAHRQTTYIKYTYTLHHICNILQ